MKSLIDCELENSGLQLSLTLFLQRRFRIIVWLALILLLVASETIAEIRHVMIFKESGRFGGWPANHGIWAWDEEIVVGFTVGYMRDRGPGKHAIDPDRPDQHWLARSRDGGESWSLEHPAEKGQLFPHGINSRTRSDGSEPDCVVPGMKPSDPSPLSVPMDFAASGFAMTLRRIGNDKGPTWLFYSVDRGHNWKGPFRFPDLGTPGVAARTDYIIDGPHEALTFLTCAKLDGEEGRPAVARTTDGGLSWEFLSFIGPEPIEFSIMPSSARLSESEIVATVRRREGPKRWIDAYVSPDNGKTWEFLSTPVSDTGEGNPPCLIRLRDGRLCLTYGFRGQPSSVRARLSSDGGKNWGPEMTLRDNGPEKDVGYTRMVQRPDGTIVTVYFFHDEPLGERFIEAAIWDPDQY